MFLQWVAIGAARSLNVGDGQGGFATPQLVNA